MEPPFSTNTTWILIPPPAKFEPRIPAKGRHSLPVRQGPRPQGMWDREGNASSAHPSREKPAPWRPALAPRGRCSGEAQTSGRGKGRAAGRSSAGGDPVRPAQTLRSSPLPLSAAAAGRGRGARRERFPASACPDPLRGRGQAWGRLGGGGGAACRGCQIGGWGRPAVCWPSLCV